MQRYVIGNWKMNLLARESVTLATEIREAAGITRRTEAWVAPSFLAIPAVAEVLRGSAIRLGSQTVHGESKGAFTGEVSPSMLREFGAVFAIIGHSERRWIMGETDSVVAAKAAGALRQEITPVFCIGESLEEFERGLTHEVLRIQLTALAEQLNAGELEKVIIAYEPCWAIGTGKVPTPEIIRDVHAFVAKLCIELQDASPRAILYGGSVNGKNFADILSIPHVHGGLIGGASLSAQSFCELVSIAERIS